MTRPGDYPIPVAIQEGSSIPLAEDASTATNQSTANTRLGDVTEEAPENDTASSGLNGRLQRIAQRLTSLIALFPSSLGAKTGANSLSVVPATDAGLATDSTLGQVRDRIGSRAAATYPEVLIAFWNAYSLTGTGSSTDLNTTEIDWAGATLQGVDAIRVTGLTVNNGTAPGGTATFTLNLYWSDVQVSLANVPTELADRKQVLSTKTLPNSINATCYWNFSGTGLIIPRARYLYLSVDKSAFAASASSALTVYLVRA